MLRFLTIFLFLLIFFSFPNFSFAKSNSYVTVVNPIRGSDFWDLKSQKPEDAVLGEMKVLKERNIPGTFLIRPDTFSNSTIINALKNSNEFEKGLFLEVTPTFAKMANIKYNRSDNWHLAGSVLLTGYTQSDRIKLIDSAFEKFKSTFGEYPKSVGAWFIDSYSLDYMYEKYGISGALIVADQYSTDNYQVWGQYFGYPYYPQKKHTLLPAQNSENKIPIVITQWAPRDPVNGYGKAVEESTYSVQPNDYIDFHDLDINYFKKLLDIYLNQEYNQINQIVVGLENSYSWNTYKSEYGKQMDVLDERRNKRDLSLLTMNSFSEIYKKAFPQISPEQVIVSNDPLGTENKSVWFMDVFYRAAWFYGRDGSVLRDVRQYLDNQEELCFSSKCETLNFATTATRVLDEVTFGQKLIIDEGRISDLNYQKNGQDFTISYKNQAGKETEIKFLLRDISIDGTISSIDGTILNTIKHTLEPKKATNLDTRLIWNIPGSILNTIKFILFVILGIFIPGFFIFKKLGGSSKTQIEEIFLSFTTGIISFSIVSYILGFLRLNVLIYGYILLLLILFFIFRKSFKIKIKKPNLYIAGIIILGTIFQVIPTFKSGLLFIYGLGFWGPNGHDGVWHVALANQLQNSLPPENPVFSGEILKNYHYLYDLLVASTSSLSFIPVEDLIFRFFPILFSLLLGLGVVSFINNLPINFEKLKNSVFIFLFPLFFVYFSGSFGWISTWLKEKVLAGESAFWANQSVSFNLNPPFAVSLIIMIAALLFISKLTEDKKKGLIILSAAAVGIVLGFKAYGAILLFIALFALMFFQFLKKRFELTITFLFSGLIALLIYIPNFKFAETFLFSPFWLVHTMIDTPDRIGWLKLSAARSAYFERGETLKFIAAEGLSFALFFIGNLGIRIFALIGLLYLKYLKNNLVLLTFVILVFSLLFPVLFIQKGTPWNTIQFFYYFLYFSGILAGIFAAFIYLKLNLVFKLIFLFFIIVITPINSLATANGYLYPLPHTYISSGELEGLNFLKNQDRGTILTYPYEASTKVKLTDPLPLFAYDTSSYVSAFSANPSFLEDEVQNEILGVDYKKRRVESKEFFASKGENNAFLNLNKIEYIYIPKFYNSFLEGEVYRVIFENEDVIIYKVK